MKDGKVLLGRCKGSHGEGEFAFYQNLKNFGGFCRAVLKRLHRKFVFFFLFLGLIGSGCVVSFWQSSLDKVEGVIGVGGFGGTELGCVMDDEPVGSRRPCNTGGVGMFVDAQDGRRIWLDKYRCDAQEILIKQPGGIVKEEYETFRCTDSLEQGQRIIAWGVIRKEQGWSMGKQTAFLQMDVSRIEK